MAFSAVTERGSAGTKISGTTVGVSPSANITVGKIAFALCVTDNTATVDGPSTNHTSVTDTDGHTWTKVFEGTETAAGVAADGVTTSLWWTLVTTQIDTSDTVTLTIGTARLAKIIGLFEVTIGAGNSISLAGSTVLGVAGASNPAAMTLSGLASKEYLFLGVSGNEGGQLTWTEDADYTNVYATEGFGTTGSGAATNVSGNAGSRIFTGTGDTFDVAGMEITEHYLGFVAFEEVAVGMVGTIAVTQGADVGAIAGTVANPITGTIAVSQAAQTMAASGTETISGTVAATQDAQTAAIAGTVAAPITGVLGATQQDQSGNLAGSLGIIGTIAVTQAPQLASGGGGGGGWSGTVANPITGTIGATQANQTSNIMGQAVTDGTWNSIQANQVGAFNGTVANPITGVLGATQASQTGALTGFVSAVAVVGTIAVTQEGDMGAISGAQTLIAVTGVLGAVQDPNVGSFTALSATAVTGVWTSTQAAQTFTATGDIGNPQEGAVVTVTCELGGPTVTCTVSPAMIIAGSNAVVTAKFYDTFGTLSDPGNVTATVQAPDGTISNPTPISSSTGIWTTTIPTDQAGYWFYQISGTGVDIDVVCTGSFCAQPSLVLV